MNEFELIDRFFKPLASGFTGSFGLSDDAACITPPAGEELVVTKDAIVEGIHFIGSEDPALIARKLLRVNLSDLAAKGATPLAYFLAVMLPKDTPVDWIARFADGLKEDQSLFNIHLAGGDTTATTGPKTFSLTAIGTVPQGTMLRRNAAKAGDFIFVSGTLGDSALGLLSLQGKLSPAPGEADKMFLEQRYLLPQPHLELGLQLRGIANACMDISDGLVQDLGHIRKASRVGAVIETDKIPLSQAAQQAIEQQPQLFPLALGGGDDYELLFTVPTEAIHKVPAGCTHIGKVSATAGITLLDAGGKSMQLAHAGFRHFD